MHRTIKTIKKLLHTLLNYQKCYTENSKIKLLLWTFQCGGADQLSDIETKTLERINSFTNT